MSKKTKTIVLLATLYFIVTSIITYLHEKYEFSIDFFIFTDENFISSFVTNMWNSFVDIILFTVILYLLLSNEEKKDTIKKYHENIDDCRFWFSEEAAFKNAANIRRLNDHNITTFDLSKSMLKNIKMKKSEFKESKFMGAVLDGANFEKSNFLRSNFQGTFMVGTKLENSTFSICNLKYAKLLNSNLKSIIIKNSDLSNSDFSNADLTASVFKDCDFSNSILKNTILKRVDLRHAKNLTVEQILQCKDIKYAKLPLEIEDEINKIDGNLLCLKKRRSADK